MATLTGTTAHQWQHFQCLKLWLRYHETTLTKVQKQATCLGEWKDVVKCIAKRSLTAIQLLQHDISRNILSPPAPTSRKMND